MLRIGLVTGDPAYELATVRGAAMLSDGRVVVLNTGTSELRFYSASGRYMMSTGRRGGGPGEFLRPEHLQLLNGDTLLVWDAGLGPVSEFDREGNYLGRVRPDLAWVMEAIGPTHSAERLTPLPDRSFVLRTLLSPDAPLPIGRVFRPSIAFFRVRPREHMDTLGWYGGLPQLFLEVGGRRIGAVAIFAFSASITAGGDPWNIYIGDGQAFTINAFNAAGRLVRSIRRTDPPRRISSRARSEARRLRIEGAANQARRADLERLLKAMPEQETYPAFRSLVVDAQGGLWAETFDQGWSVFDAAGRWLGSVDLGSIRPLEIGRDYVLGVVKDASNVERVVLHRLSRPP